MNPLLYCLIGVAGGAFLAAFAFFLARRDSKVSPLILGKVELLERAQEREEKVFRDELARNREENANAMSKRGTKAANAWIMRSNCRAKGMAQQCGCRSTPNFRWKIISD